MFKFVVAALSLIASPLLALTPDESLKALVDGNDRFMKNARVQYDTSDDRRLEGKSGQSPFAVILGCSDSRVAPEIVFDQSLGSLFVVRVAGNAIGQIELDSIDYSVLVLKSSLILVLGHQACGAVDAVLAGNTKAIPGVAKWIEESVNGQKLSLEDAIKANVMHSVRALREHAALAPLIKDNKLKVVGGYYSMRTGKVSLIEENQ